MSITKLPSVRETNQFNSGSNYTSERENLAARRRQQQRREGCLSARADGLKENINIKQESPMTGELVQTH